MHGLAISVALGLFCIVKLTAERELEENLEDLWGSDHGTIDGHSHVCMRIGGWARAMAINSLPPVRGQEQRLQTCCLVDSDQRIRL